MAPDEMRQQFGEYTAVEVARHVGDLRVTTSSSRSWNVGRMPRRAISGLMSGLRSRLRTHTESGTVEPAPPHAIRVSH
jgi:hypothetical protein